MAKLRNQESEVIQVRLDNPATLGPHAVRYDQLLSLISGTPSAHTHTASQVVDFNSAVAVRVQGHFYDSATVDFAATGDSGTAHVRVQPGGGVLISGDGLYVDWPDTGTSHYAVTVSDGQSIELGITPGQLLSAELRIDPNVGGLVIGESGTGLDFGTGHDQAARGDHVHVNDHVAVTVQSSASLGLGLTGQHLTGTVTVDPSPGPGRARVFIGASGLYLEVGSGTGIAADNHTHPEATETSSGLISAELYRKLVNLGDVLEVDQVALFSRHDPLASGTYVGGRVKWGQVMQLLDAEVTALPGTGIVTVGLEIGGSVVDTFQIPTGTPNIEVNASPLFTDLYVPADTLLRVKSVAALNNIEIEPAVINISVRARPAVDTAPTVRLNCGGVAEGNFAEDAYYDAGSAGGVSNYIDRSAVTEPAPSVCYQRFRSKFYDAGTLTYDVSGLARGLDYLVRLHFSENYWANTGENVFTIQVLGSTTQQTANFDIRATAGARYKAVIQEYTLKADASGHIRIKLHPQPAAFGYQCSINAIELLPQ